MTIVISFSTSTTPGPTVLINCPKCKEEGVSADTYEEHEVASLFWILPIMSFRNTYLQCEACQKKLRTNVRLDDLKDYSREELSTRIGTPGSFIGSALAIISLIICWVPIVGLVMGLLSTAVNFRVGGWRLVLSCVSVIAQIVVVGLFIGTVFFKL